MALCSFRPGGKGGGGKGRLLGAVLQRKKHGRVPQKPLEKGMKEITPISGEGREEDSPFGLGNDLRNTRRTLRQKGKGRGGRKGSELAEATLGKKEGKRTPCQPKDTTTSRRSRPSRKRRGEKNLTPLP